MHHQPHPIVGDDSSPQSQPRFTPLPRFSPPLFYWGGPGQEPLKKVAALDDDTSGVQARALKLKTEGNAHHKAGRFDEAAARYRSALELQPQHAVHYANLAASLLVGRCSLSLLGFAARCSPKATI